jgi:hypothetical protein
MIARMTLFSSTDTAAPPATTDAPRGRPCSEHSLPVRASTGLILSSQGGCLPRTTACPGHVCGDVDDDGLALLFVQPSRAESDAEGPWLCGDDMICCGYEEEDWHGCLTPPHRPAVAVAVETTTAAVPPS